VFYAGHYDHLICLHLESPTFQLWPTILDETDHNPRSASDCATEDDKTHDESFQQTPQKCNMKQGYLLHATFKK
jgi:hypothetical protein